jgi:hypothetical protein
MLAGSSFARTLNVLRGLQVVHLLVFVVYGPGQHDRMKLVPYAITSLLHGARPKRRAVVARSTGSMSDEASTRLPAPNALADGLRSTVDSCRAELEREKRSVTDPSGG